jgi:hypothetical protein
MRQSQPPGKGADRPRQSTDHRCVRPTAPAGRSERSTGRGGRGRSAVHSRSALPAAGLRLDPALELGESALEDAPIGICTGECEGAPVGGDLLCGTCSAFGRGMELRRSRCVLRIGGSLPAFRL